MRTLYQVRFVCYQYNCGGSLGNGNRLLTKNFTELPPAKEFAAQVKRLARQPNGEIPEGSNAFARGYTHDGFVENLVGIFKITEEKIE